MTEGAQRLTEAQRRENLNRYIGQPDSKTKGESKRYGKTLRKAVPRDVLGAWQPLVGRTSATDLLFSQDAVRVQELVVRNARLLFVRDGQSVKFLNEFAAELFKRTVGNVAAGKEADAFTFKLFMQFVRAARNRLIGTHSVHAPHEKVTQYYAEQSAFQQAVGDLETGVGFQA